MAIQSLASTRVAFTVLDVQPVNAGRLLAVAMVEINIDGVIIAVHGIQALWTEPVGAASYAHVVLPISSLLPLNSPRQARRFLGRPFGFVVAYQVGLPQSG